MPLLFLCRKTNKINLVICIDNVKHKEHNIGRKEVERMKKMYSFRFEIELMDKLKEKADEGHRTVSNLIETILWNWIRNH